jgi:hypothetical protein
MGTQLEGNRMKEPKKMKMGGMLEMLSPAAAIAKSLRTGKAEGILGALPIGALHNKKRKDREGPEGPKGPTGVTGMKAGGRVSRGDGACMKGHTKGKMR